MSASFGDDESEEPLFLKGYDANTTDKGKILFLYIKPCLRKFNLLRLVEQGLVLEKGNLYSY